MDMTSEPQKRCPLKEEDCSIQTEVRRLRQECKRLQKLTRIDALTGFYNFGYLTTALEGEMERTRRSGLYTSLIMLDLDHFKKLNDTYGHEVGNKALKWVCNILRSNLRRIDVPCRYGGEEFTIILPGIRLSQAVRATERLRIDIDNKPIPVGEGKIKITASFGVDTYEGKKEIPVGDFIKRADNYLLEAKENGRNQVCYNRKKIEDEMTEVTSKERESLLFYSSHTRSSE